MTVCPLQEMEAQEEASEQQREAARRRIVEEERQKLLKRHATQLLGYLPKVRRGEVMRCGMQVFRLSQREEVFKPLVSVLHRVYCVKRTWSIWTKTSGETFKHVRQTSSLQMLGRPAASFRDLSFHTGQPDGS